MLCIGYMYIFYQQLTLYCIVVVINNNIILILIIREGKRQHLCGFRGGFLRHNGVRLRHNGVHLRHNGVF